ncbi:DUF4083 domain-containing protein [Jeotgalibacillus proteolyticus]|uniref:DUF4083 domain-containing protein n=1 Tax=Jeotgalibacillus proteolyticus TaxID=2082395 RepID=A0A2S5GAC4_9BACL|nr:DUF4083 domain-containing protein [Jeotgalibacillus proteolyticus]
MIFQLFSLGFLVLVVVGIVMAIRSYTKHRNQLSRIEEKLDTLNEHKRKDKKS